jgi:pimeloyl-ACP methyl ester carboxylesterase
MPFANNQGVRIHYEVEGQGPPLVLQHGFGSTLYDWYQGGYVDGLNDDYRLILVDARGHGQSDKPHDPSAYAMAELVGDIVAVLDDLGVARAHYFGHSLGAGIGFGIAKYAPQRFESLIIHGGGPPESREDPWNNQILQLLRTGREATKPIIREMFGLWWTPERERRSDANDYEAMIASVLGDETPVLDDVVGTLKMPCLFVVGESDPGYSSAKVCCERVPTAVFVSLPGLSHIESMFRGDLSLPHVRRFLAEATRVQVSG